MKILKLVFSLSLLIASCTFVFGALDENKIFFICKSKMKRFSSKYSAKKNKKLFYLRNDDFLYVNYKNNKVIIASRTDKSILLSVNSASNENIHLISELINEGCSIKKNLEVEKIYNYAEKMYKEMNITTACWSKKARKKYIANSIVIKNKLILKNWSCIAE